jgi:hypothetical protein
MVSLFRALSMPLSSRNLFFGKGRMIRTNGHARKIAVEAWKLVVEACGLVVEACKLVVEACKLVVEKNTPQYCDE